MKSLPVLCLIAFAPFAPAAEGLLSEPERETLLEKLENLGKEAKGKVTERFDSAGTAFRRAMASDAAAVELYLKCIEKVNFIDQERSSQDFRDWKRRHGKMEDEGYIFALRHQLRWLVLTMEAAENRDDLGQLGPDASAALESLAAHSEKFESKASKDELRKKATSTIFAQAYGLAGLEIEDWPLSPIPLAEVYDNVILPPLRSAGNTDTLREQWNNRIRYETHIKENWSGGERETDDPLHPEYAKFLTEVQPELIWQREVDVFKAGDQRTAALNMLAHLEKNLAHHKAPEWAQQFRSLVDPKVEEASAEDDSAGDEAG